MNHSAPIIPGQNVHQRPLPGFNFMNQAYAECLPLPVEQPLRYLKDLMPEVFQNRFQAAETAIRISRLQAEVIALRRELATLKQEKSALRTRLEEIQTLKPQGQGMQIAIDHTKRVQQVAEIVRTDYFKQLQVEVERLRYPADGS
ncbi:hypothetical protein [Egbenema bharatensis]|uniref:hypothetical protein n=1 Tax=Egbenema bharatensis TaxID=3463334 RepID=UPI003A86CA01